MRVEGSPEEEGAHQQGPARRGLKHEPEWPPEHRELAAPRTWEQRGALPACARPDALPRGACRRGPQAAQRGEVAAPWPETASHAPRRFAGTQFRRTVMAALSWVAA